MSFILSLDRAVFLAINGVAGEIPLIDGLMRLLVNDYFVPVVLCLFLLGLWFGARASEQRRQNQIGVIAAASGMGITSGFVKISNLLLWRARPFQDMPSVLNTVNRLFYPPHDPSFPSNATAIAFAIATGVWMGNRRAGTLCFIVATFFGFARVYIGVHYPLDVIGGAALGTITSYLFYKAFVLIKPLPRFIFRAMSALHLA